VDLEFPIAQHKQVEIAVVVEIERSSEHHGSLDDCRDRPPGLAPERDAHAGLDDGEEVGALVAVDVARLERSGSGELGEDPLRRAKLRLGGLWHDAACRLRCAHLRKLALRHLRGIRDLGAAFLEVRPQLVERLGILLAVRQREQARQPEHRRRVPKLPVRETDVDDRPVELLRGFQVARLELCLTEREARR